MFGYSKGYWSSKEFDQISFGDPRLDRRFKKTTFLISENPQSSINKSCRVWSQAKGAYRMFGNRKVTSDKILQAHQAKTAERFASSTTPILAIQDTSFLNYDEHLSTDGLGHIGTGGNKGHHTQGLVMHTTYSVNASGLPLGIINQEIWSRTKEPMGRTKKDRKAVPIEEKESMKWLRSLEITNSFSQEIQRPIVTIADRESDVFEFLQESNGLCAPFVIRAVRNRIVIEDTGNVLIWDKLAAERVAGQITVEIPSRGGRVKRQAELELRYCHLAIKGPKERKSTRTSPSESIFGIMVSETKAPKGLQPLEWVLLTNLKIETFQEAYEKVQWYQLRWQIEIFHKILKSNCKVEECRLNTSIQLKKYITLSSIVAWRLHWMTLAARQTPNQSCSVILEEVEWKILYSQFNPSKKLPQQPPTIREAVRWIAQLGGFLARKSDGEPGIITLARGWETLKHMVQGLQILQKSEVLVGNR